MLMLNSCGEYQKVLKNPDVNYRYEYAKQAFEKGKYGQTITILEELVTLFKGTANAEESLYLLALSHYENQDYMNSGSYFKTYYQHYPKGQYTELARFYAGYGYYLDSPEPQLDQTGTYKAIEELQNFLDYFPKSDKATIAQNAIFELQDKLVLKELQNAQLYYNLGTYMGNNYQSAVIVAENAIKDYPYSKYKEALAKEKGCSVRELSKADVNKSFKACNLYCFCERSMKKAFGEFDMVDEDPEAKEGDGSKLDLINK